MKYFRRLLVIKFVFKVTLFPQPVKKMISSDNEGGPAHISNTLQTHRGQFSFNADYMEDAEVIENYLGKS